MQQYLAAVKADVVEHADDFQRTKSEDEEGPFAQLSRLESIAHPLSRYRVNVPDGHVGVSGAPVVYEDRPTFQNLIGRVEQVAQMGTLVIQFTRIKAGALHRANGGYLILDDRRLLLEPFAWEGLTRALRTRAIRVESLGEALSLVSTVSLYPEPIPLNVKVVLIGEPILYYLLYPLDPDFTELFKVAVDLSRFSIGRPSATASTHVSSPRSRAARRSFSRCCRRWRRCRSHNRSPSPVRSVSAARSRRSGTSTSRSKNFSTSARREGSPAIRASSSRAANVHDLMPRADIIEAAEAGTFHVHAIKAVDEGLDLLTRQPAGIRDKTGRFPIGTVNYLVEQRLATFAQQARTFKVAGETATAPSGHEKERR